MEQKSSYSSMKMIHQCFEKAINAYPAYGRILPFFKSVYTLQEASLNNIHVAPPFMSPRLLKAGLETGIPMMDRQYADIDVPEALVLLHALCEEAKKAGNKLAKGADSIKKCLSSDADTLKKGFRILVVNDNKRLIQLAGQLEIDEDGFGFFLYNSIWPSLASHARQFNRQCSVNGSWTRGYCPVCGCLPSLSFFNEIGRRHFVCEFCRNQWEVTRDLCPNCDFKKNKRVNYFYSEDEKAYRTYTCENCKTYIKTVDTRELSRPFFPPLEIIITLHLDLKAEKLGYNPVSVDMHLM